jgi:uncharacterized cupredoxin-like copper-binding protein
MKKTTLAITITALASLAAVSLPLRAHSPMMHDPAHKEKMQQMMKHHGGHGAHAHGFTAVKEQKEWGIAGDADKVSRTIHIDMSDDMKFSPAMITIKKGETIRFHVANKGKVLHEMVIGTKQELDAHAEMMKKHPNMEHDEAYMAHVDPGQKGEIVWLFNREGEFDFACLIPGHYEAGMKGKIRVTS